MPLNPNDPTDQRPLRELVAELSVRVVALTDKLEALGRRQDNAMAQRDRLDAGRARQGGRTRGDHDR